MADKRANRIVETGEADPKEPTPNTRNWRKHPALQGSALSGVLGEVGWVAPVTINRTTGRIVDGHLRVELALKRGESAVPVQYVELNEREEALVLATLDPIAGLAEPDTEKLDALLRAVETEDLAVQRFVGQIPEDHGLVFGRQVGAMAEVPEAQVDRAQELLQKWATTPGQLWEIPSKSLPGRSHRLLCGDSTVEADVVRLMKGDRATLFSTDPPYAVGYDGTNHPHQWDNPKANKDWSGAYKDFDKEEDATGFFDAFIRLACVHAITVEAAWYCWHASVRSAALEAAWVRRGAFVHQQIIWVKDRPILSRNWYLWQHEPCFFGWIRPHKPKRASNDQLRTVWEFPTTRPGTKTDHPTSKPVELFAIPMAQHTVEGDICYEPFAGSGSQQVAGEQMARLVYGIEKAPEFVAVILQRMADMGLEPRLKGCEENPQHPLEG